MAIYNINGQEIHTIEEGAPNRQKAILLHGWSSSWYAMSPLMSLLSQRFSCISIDLPGYGLSPPFKERATIPAYANLLADFIEEVSDGPVVLVGHSMGGMISLAMVLDHAILVERMVLICPTISGRLSTMINILISPITLMERFGLGRLLVSSVENAVVGLTDRLMRPVSFAERTSITEDDVSRLRSDARRPKEGRVRAECYFAMRDNDLTGKLSGIETPSLVLWGAEDNTVPLRDAGIVAEEWPLADLRIIPNAGHWPHFETPEITQRRIAAFLGLPLLSDALHSPVGDDEITRIHEVAQFLAGTSVGNNLNLTQRTRLAAQFKPRVFEAFTNIVKVNEAGREMYVVQDGTVEVWQDPENPGENPQHPRRVATVMPGQMTGEFAMLDEGMRTADLISGPDGATVLALDRDRLLALLEDDPVLGSTLLWNFSTSLSQKSRFILWQLQRTTERAKEAERRRERETQRPVG